MIFFITVLKYAILGGIGVSMENKDLIIKEISYKSNGEKYVIVCEGKGIYEGCKIGGYRYMLEIDIKSLDDKLTQTNKTLACIMMNPSTTFPDEIWKNSDWKKELGFEGEEFKNPRKTTGFDSTVTNVLKMAASKGYSKVCIFNLFPYIHPKGKIAVEYYKKQQTKNKTALKHWNSTNCEKVLVAWGSSLPQKSEVKNYKDLQAEYIRIFREEKHVVPVFYAWNESANCPYHPSSQVNSAWTMNENHKIVHKVKGDGKPGIIQQFIDNTEDFQIWKNFPEKK